MPPDPDPPAPNPTPVPTPAPQPEPPPPRPHPPGEPLPEADNVGINDPRHLPGEVPDPLAPAPPVPLD